MIDIPDGKPKDNGPALEEEYRLAVREYLQGMSSGSTGLDAKNRVKALDKLPFSAGSKIIDDEKKHLMSLPESMYISDEAFRRLQKKWADAHFRFTYLKGLPEDKSELRGFLEDRGKDGAIDEMAELARKNRLTGDFWEITDVGSGLIIYQKDNRVVAFTAFHDRDINGTHGIQVALQIKEGQYAENAGVGIAMLEQLIKKIKHSETPARFISLHTMLKPSGLGNLGFEYVEDGKLSALYEYKLDLTD